MIYVIVSILDYMLIWNIYIYIERLYVSSIDHDLSLNLQMDICLKINWLCF